MTCSRRLLPALAAIALASAACARHRGTSAPPIGPDSALVGLDGREVRAALQRLSVGRMADAPLTMFIGRIFVAADTARAGVEVAIISRALWVGLDAGADLLGRPIVVNGRAVIVVGVAEPAPPDQAARRVWLPERP